MSLQVWLPLNGDFKNNGSYPSQDFELPTGGSWKTPADGVGRSGLMVSNGGVKRIYPSLNGKTACTISVWFRLTPDSTITNFADIVTIGYQDGGSVRFEVHGGNKVNIFGNGLSSGGMGAIPTSKGEWHQQAIVIKDGTITRYKDGVYLNSVTLSSTSILDGSVNLGDTGMYCMLADIRIYDEVLSAKQIKEISKGLVLHYALKGAAGGANVLPEATTIPYNTVNERSYTIASTSGSPYYEVYNSNPKITYPGTIYTLSFDAKSNADNTPLAAYFYSSESGYTTTKKAVTSQGNTSTGGDGAANIYLSTEWKRYWVTYTQTDDNYAKRIQLRVVRPSSGSRTAFVRNVKFEKGDRATQYCPPSSNPLYSQLGFDSAIEKDLSGFGHDSMTIYALPDIDTTSPRYCTAYDFAENIEKRVRTQQTHDFDFTDNFTWSCWAKARAKTDTSTGAQYAFSVGRADATPYGYGLHPNNAGTTWIASFGSTSWITVASDVPINTWHHFAFTKKGTTIKTFMDGELKTESEFSGTLPTYPAQNPGPGIGYFRYHNGTTESIMYPLNGCVSDFRIYATALSDDDIRELYAFPASIDNQGNLFTYELNEISREKVDISQNGETHTNMFTVFTDNDAATPSTRATKTSFYEDNKVVSHDFIEY